MSISTGGSSLLLWAQSGRRSLFIVGISRRPCDDLGGGTLNLFRTFLPYGTFWSRFIIVGRDFLISSRLLLLRIILTGALGASTDVFGIKAFKLVACYQIDFRISLILGLFLQFLSRHVFISVFSSFEKLAAIVAYLPFIIFKISAPWLVAVNGGLPVQSSYKTQPRPQTSLLSLYGSSLINSGAR